MEYFSIFITYGLVFIALFGIPIKHILVLIKGDEYIADTYEEPEKYKELAMKLIGNFIFIILVFLIFGFLLNSMGSGSLSGVLMLPFFVIYIAVMITYQKEINRLPLNNENKWSE